LQASAAAPRKASLQALGRLLRVARSVAATPGETSPGSREEGMGRERERGRPATRDFITRVRGLLSSSSRRCTLESVVEAVGVARVVVVVVVAGKP
jgi:hypothetical protein